MIRKAYEVGMSGASEIHVEVWAHDRIIYIREWQEFESSLPESFALVSLSRVSVVCPAKERGSHFWYGIDDCAIRGARYSVELFSVAP